MKPIIQSHVKPFVKLKISYIFFLSKWTIAKQGIKSNRIFDKRCVENENNFLLSSHVLLLKMVHRKAMI